MASFYDFPQELVIQILSLLPVLCVLRCKSVCKMWLYIISDPAFTQTHLTNSSKRPSVLTGTQLYDDCGNRNFSVISNAFGSALNLHMPSCLVGAVANDIFTSANGLVCLTNPRRSDIYIWNPATRQCCKILASPLIPPDRRDGPFIGFYFDSVSSDYKVLRIVPHRFPVRVELYSTNSESWRELHVDKVYASSVRCRYAAVVNCGPVINGVLYLDGRGELISFQLRSEVFKPVPLPDSKLRDVVWSRSRVFDCEGRVGIILHCHEDEALSLWSLDEDDGSGIVSWTKNLILETSFRTQRTITYLGDGKLVTYENFRRIILYDYKTKKIKKFRHPTWQIATSPQKYTESLVSIKGFFK